MKIKKGEAKNELNFASNRLLEIILKHFESVFAVA